MCNKMSQAACCALCCPMLYAIGSFKKFGEMIAAHVACVLTNTCWFCVYSMKMLRDWTRTRNLAMLKTVWLKEKLACMSGQRPNWSQPQLNLVFMRSCWLQWSSILMPQQHCRRHTKLGCHILLWKAAFKSCARHIYGIVLAALIALFKSPFIVHCVL